MRSIASLKVTGVRSRTFGPKGTRAAGARFAVTAAVLCGTVALLSGCSDDTKQAAPTTALPTPTVVEVTITDTAFTPSESLGFRQGDFVIFRFRNNGTVEHEAVVGDELFQTGHGEHQHADGAEMANAVLLKPGEQGDVPYRFEQAGEFIIGCHIDSFYESGLRTTFTVEPTA